MLDESEITDAVRARFEALESVPYPMMILRSMPKTFADPDVTPKIQELARISVRLPDLERIALCEEIFKHVKGLPKTPGRRIFNDAYIEARDKAAGEGSAEGASAEKKTSKRDLRKAKGHVTAADGCLWRETPLGEKERFTNWAPVPTHRVLRLDKADKSKREWIRCVIKGPELAIWATEGNTTRDLIEEHLFPGDVWGSKRKLVDHLPSRLVVNGGSDDDVMGIYEMFMRDYDYENLPIIRSTAVLGRHRMPDGTVRYVEACGTIGPDGQWMAEPDLVYIPEGGCSIAHRLPHRAPGRRLARDPRDPQDVLRERLSDERPREGGGDPRVVLRDALRPRAPSRAGRGADPEPRGHGAVRQELDHGAPLLAPVHGDPR